MDTCHHSAGIGQSEQEKHDDRVPRFPIREKGYDTILMVSVRIFTPSLHHLLGQDLARINMLRVKNASGQG
jgi:hypothetical protein